MTADVTLLYTLFYHFAAAAAAKYQLNPRFGANGDDNNSSITFIIIFLARWG